ncbi:MAG: amidohydrolase [Deltaproteobacteria bacterium]|nr:amidohydrolase [Deltaproteobacteria bacterium]MBW2138259.1 amidohydrolase [Deltaproteobacteria bacterium]
MNDKIMAIDVMNYPFTPEGMKKFWSSPEMKEMSDRVLGGHTPKGVPPQEFIAQMDEAGFEKVFISAVKMGSYRGKGMANDFSAKEVHDMIKDYPDRLVGMAGYDPTNILESLREIETAVKEYGFKGVYAHLLGWDMRPDDRRMYPCYIKCIELGIPFSMQIGHSLELMPSESGRPVYIDKVALDLPELTFIASHTGWPWCEELVAMVSKHPNVYMDISAHLPRYLDPSIVKFMDTRGKDKVLFGTNAFGLKRCKDQLMDLPLKEETKGKVLRENATRVFRLD